MVVSLLVLRDEDTPMQKSAEAMIVKFEY